MSPDDDCVTVTRGSSRASTTTRRRLLAALGTGALAGCVDRPAGSGSPTPGGGDSPGASGEPPGTVRPVPSPDGRTVGDAFAAGDRTVTVESAAVRRSVASADVGSPAHVDVAAPADAQFVACEVRFEGGPVPAVEDFGVVADGGTGAVRTLRWRTFRTDESPLLVAVEVPVGRYDRAAVTWRRPDGDPVRWALPREAVRALGRVPEFAVRRFAVPDAVREGRAIDVTLDVANAGGRDGRFLAELGAVVVSDVGEVRFDVPAGGSVTREVALTPGSYTPMYGDEGDPLRVVLDWGAGRMEREVAVDRR